MQQFLKQVLYFLSLVTLSCITIYSMADGATDAFYLKLTTPKQKSLILGSSRAAQGLHPKIINNIISDSKIYNYAFSRVHTPYGKTYFESIKKKLDHTSITGIFILEVNPWSICLKTNELDDAKSFLENSMFLGQVSNVTIKPNFEYLIKSFDKRAINLLSDKLISKEEHSIFVNDDGWLEVRLFETTFRQARRFSETIKAYTVIKHEYSGVSQERLRYLNEIIKYLKPYGMVYLVRMPIDNKILSIEHQLVPDFDSLMYNLSIELDVKYINAIPFSSNYKYTDGHHLNISSGKEFSQYIANIIESDQQLNK